MILPDELSNRVILLDFPADVNYFGRFFRQTEFRRAIILNTLCKVIQFDRVTAAGKFFDFDSIFAAALDFSGCHRVKNQSALFKFGNIFTGKRHVGFQPAAMNTDRGNGIGQLQTYFAVFVVLPLQLV